MGDVDEFDGVAGHRVDGEPDGCEDPGCVEAKVRGDRWIGAYLSFGEEGRAHFHHTDVLHVKVQEQRSASFVQTCELFTESPDDFVVAWQYLNAHPIFSRPLLPPHLCVKADELNEEELDQVYNADMFDEDGLRDMWMTVTRNENDEVEVWLEHGPHLWLEDVAVDHRHWFHTEGQSSHDHELDVYASTYELAVVELANKVRFRYGDDRSRVKEHF